MNPFLDFLSEGKPKLDKLISDYVQRVESNQEIPDPLKQGLIYAMEGGGKRLRPALTLMGWEAVRDWYGVDDHFHKLAPQVFERSALAVELIHTYSLVHDDLPAMDDDSLRRGRPTCHVRFDEATAILIGDALLNHSFEIIMAEPFVTSELAESMGDREIKELLTGLLRTAKMLSTAAGAEGMVGGQILDMEAEKKEIGFEGLKRIHLNKTGKLIQASLNLMPAFFGEHQLITALGHYSRTVGLLYQDVDDILDVVSTPEEMGKSGTDQVNQKTTFVKLLGLQGAQDYAAKLNQESQNSIQKFNESHEAAGRRLSSRTLDCLIGFSNYIWERRH